jgi:integrase
MAATEVSFTKAALNNLAIPPPGKRLEVHDIKTPGLMIRVTNAGTKTFTIYKRVKGKPQRIKLGCYPDMTIEQARRQAQKVLSRVAEGIDPVIERRAQRARSVTLKEALDAYLDARELKLTTIKDYRAAVRESYPDWLDKPLVFITKDMVERRHRQRGEQSKARANLAMRLLRAVFNYAAAKYEDAEGHSLIKENPVKRLSDTRAWFRVNRRQWVIKNHQLPAWFDAVMRLRPERDGSKAEVARSYLLMVLFTGLRKEEAKELKWHDIDFEGRTFTVIDPKNRDDHTLPLPDFLYDLLVEHRQHAYSDYVFASIGESKYGADLRYWIGKITEASQVKFTLHDLRRTFTTTAESLDISAYALKRLLNHRISQSDVTAGYIITDVERLRTPMQKINNHLLLLANMHFGRSRRHRPSEVRDSLYGETDN